MENKQVIDEGEATQFKNVRHGFMVGDLNLLVPSLTRCEVTVQSRICTIPSTPEWFAGFINYRGEAIPVYDLSRYLGFEVPPASSQKWILQIASQSGSIGLLIYHYPQVIIDPIEDQLDIAQLPEKIQPFVGSIYAFQAKKWVDFDCQQMISEMKKFF